MDKLNTLNYNIINILQMSLLLTSINKSQRFDCYFPLINNLNHFVAVSKLYDNAKPTIIFLHGGPGMALSSILDDFLIGIEQFSNLVIFDQRGAGLSFGTNIAVETMTLDQLIDDTKNVSEWIKANFDSNKIILAGHSWGSSLGIYTVNRYPETFEAFISAGQWLIDEKIVIEAKINEVKILSKQNPIIAKNLDKIIATINENFYWVEDILIENGLKISNSTDTWKYQVNLVNNSKLYSNKEKENYFKGMEFSEHLYNDIVSNYNVNKDINELSIPSLFLMGQNDLITPKQPTIDFLKKADANEIKHQLVIIKNSRHYSFIDQSKIFQSSILEFLNKIEVI